MAARPNTRRNTTIAAAICYLITIPFLLLVLIGNVSNHPILSQIYFFKLDVSHIIPISVQNASLLNSVARSLGLHDFYQVGLWNFCEGYNDEGVTHCSEPKTFYWFNPVEVLVSELLSGAKIALPSQVITILRVLKIGSQIMYGFFMAGTVLNAILLFATPLALRSRWWSLPLSIFSGISSIVISVAAIIATVISVAAKVALTAQDQLNISADIGVRMLCFMWIATILSDVAFFLHAAMGCCCRPDRKSGSQDGSAVVDEEKRSGFDLPSLIRRRKAANSSPLSDT